MAQESSLAEQWINATLSGDSTLSGLVSGIWRGKAIRSATAPYVIFSEQSGRYENAAGGVAFAVLYYQIVVLSGDNTDQTNADAAIDRIDALLRNADATYNGYRVSVKPFTPVNVPETGENDITYRRKGTIWALSIAPSS